MNKYITKESDDETKKHSRTSSDVQFKEFLLTKQKPKPRRDFESIGKTISKKIRSKNKKTENQSQNAACEQKTTSQKGKFG